MIIHSPLRVPVTKRKDFILNLNNYRNAHFRTLHTAKHNYHYAIWPHVQNLPFLTTIELELIVYHGSYRKVDTGNISSVHEKFFCDVLVCGDPFKLKRNKRGGIVKRVDNKIEDDNYNHIVKVSSWFGGVDKENPRVDIIIKDVHKK